MRILVIGAGGVGAPFGASLAKSGEDVTFLVRPPTADALRARGLVIEGRRGSVVVEAPKVVQPGELAGVFDIALITTKLWDLDEAARSLAGRLDARSFVIPLQNGVEAADIVAAALPSARVAGGVAHINATIESAGRIRQNSPTQRLVCGLLSGVREERLDAFVRACRKAGFEAEQSPDMPTTLWEKFISLVPVSAATALTRLSIGAVREDDMARVMLDRLMAETVAVGRAAGVDISDALVAERRAYIDAMPYGANASMAKDLAQGRRLELPWLSGRVSELGRRHAVPTPANDFVNSALSLYVAGRPATTA